ncbi:MAG: carboxypeptidase regulatory-like domain-containing protein [Bryobacteraceae bacterium]|nr:carboxypeptidase regulatory-like domain-containing protein [Bryobacteraceae bacterium]
MRVGAFVAALLAAAVAFGQATDGHITGTVLDATGAVIPGADVELTNVTTDVVRAARSDGSGIYRFQNVLAGRYRLTVRAEGFAPATVENIDITLNRATTLNVTLGLAAVASQVDVVEAAAQIDTTSATIGSAYGQAQAIYNPLSSQAYGVYNLALMSAGVASSGGLGVGDGPSVGGQRPRQNNFTLEGVDNNRKDVTGVNLAVPHEAVAEFSALQNQFSSEFGHSTGGQFNVALRSGSNQYHGAAYWYLQNRHLNAVDEADARQGIRQNPRYDRNSVGASVGGPLIRNKLFYYGLMEYNPLGAASSPYAATMTPTAEGYRMLESIPGLSRANLDVLQRYATPAPAQTGTAGVGGFDVPVGILPITFPNYSNNYNWVANADYNAGDRDQLRFRYVEARTAGIDITVSPNLPAFAGDRTIRQRTLALSEFHNFHPALLNELRLNYSRYSDRIPAGDFSFPGLDVFPNITIEHDLNLQLGPFDGAPQSTTQNIYQLVDNLTWIKGSHTIKGGIDARQYIAPTNFISRVRGDYNYSTLERYLLDLQPDLMASRNAGGRPYWGNAWNFYWFIQDEMKLRRNLTLTLGLRHEYKGILADDRLQALNQVADVPGLIAFQAPKARKRNFAPRGGLTWSPGDSGKTVFRAGAGMAYDNYFDNLGASTKPPQLQTSVILPGGDKPNFLGSGGISLQAPTAARSPAQWRASTAGYIFDQRLPVSYQWTFGIERVLGKDYTLNVRYLGTRGSALFVQEWLNVQSVVTANHYLPTYLQRPSQTELDGLPLTLDGLAAEFEEGGFYRPEFLAAGFYSPLTAFPNIGNSTYHGLATEFTRRFSSGFLFNGAYTWSKAIDDSTADLFSTVLSPRRPQDFDNLRAERSRSFLDRTHRLSMTWVWETPWMKTSANRWTRNVAGNWLLSGSYIVESPQYATVQSGTDSNLNADPWADRVIVNPGGVDRTGSGVSPLRNSAGQIVGYLANDAKARYIRAEVGAYANGGRQTLPLRGINSWNLAVIKKIPLAESKALELRAQFYNAFNHPQYVPGYLDNVASRAARQTRNHLIPGNPWFNDPTRVYSSNPRYIQLAARFTY